MTNLIWIYLVTQATWMMGSLAFFYHDLSMETIEQPDTLQNDSYFGFSVAYRDSPKSLLIGAPTADKIGKLFSCDIDAKNCTEIKQNSVQLDKLSKYTHNYWLGAVIKSNPSFVVTCAPRVVQISDIYQHTFIEAGICIEIPNDSETNKKLPQIKTKDRQFDLKDPKPEETMDSFGWAIDIANDDSIIVGGPAMSTGRVMVYGKARFSPTTRPGSIVNSNNLGYSVASGYFKSNKIVYAVGTPFGQHGSGQVFFFNEQLKRIGNLGNPPEDHPSNGKNSLVGAMFGAVLCSAKLTQDSDLLVGAPTYSKYVNQYNTGVVFIYLKNSRRQTQIYSTKIVGFQDGSMFGSAIISVGDLDGDNKDEIVIAAPYEDDGKGAVYLYSGADLINNKSPAYRQRIQSKNQYAFGLTLAPMRDYDENGCNELAIGAPESNTVTVVKCMASVKIRTSAIFPDLQNRKSMFLDGCDGTNKTYFMFKSCVEIYYPPKPKKIVATLSVNVKIFHNNAALADPRADAQYNISLHEKILLHCRCIGVILPKDGLYDEGIYYKINASLLDNPINRKKFEPSRVLLNTQSQLSTNDIVWATECDHKSCEPKLTVEISTNMGDRYMSGSTDSEPVFVKITNAGDIAYSACLEMNVTGAPIKNYISENCAKISENFIVCNLRPPLRKDGIWKSEVLSIDTSQLTNKDTQITLDVALYSKCSDKSKSVNDNKIITLYPDLTGITIKGKTNIGNVVELTIDNVKYQGKKMEHIYEITNYGYTNLLVSNYKVLLPKINYIEYSTVKLYDQSLHSALDVYVCTKTKDDKSQYDIAQCNHELLNKNSQINIVVSIEVKPGTLNSIIDKQNVTVSTSIIVNIDSKNHSEKSTETVLTLLEAVVDLWIIILAVCIGFMLLLIILLILCRMGLLKRKNKEKLERLQKSIRRQTIRRSMMAQASQAGRQRILDQNEDGIDIAEDVTEPKCKIEGLHTKLD